MILLQEEFLKLRTNAAVKNKKVVKESLEESSLTEVAAEDRFNIKKYGFVRAPQEDFSDDGNRFTGFYYDPERTGDTRFSASKLIDRQNGQVYFSVCYQDPDNYNIRKYFDRLNGVSIRTAVEELPDLVKELEEFKEKTLPSLTSIKLTPELKEKILDTANSIGGKTPYAAIVAALEKLGYDENRFYPNDLSTLQYEYKERYFAEPSHEEIKKIAAKYYRDVVKRMQSGYDYNRRWKSGDDLETALNRAYLPTSELKKDTAEKIKAWVRKKLSDDDFEL